MYTFWSDKYSYSAILYWSLDFYWIRSSFPIRIHFVFRMQRTQMFSSNGSNVIWSLLLFFSFSPSWQLEMIDKKIFSFVSLSFYIYISSLVHFREKYDIRSTSIHPSSISFDSSQSWSLRYRNSSSQILISSSHQSQPFAIQWSVISPSVLLVQSSWSTETVRGTWRMWYSEDERWRLAADSHRCASRPYEYRFLFIEI